MCCSQKSCFNEVDHSFFSLPIGDNYCIQLDLEMLVSTFVCEKLSDYRDRLNFDPIYYPTTTTNLLLKVSYFQNEFMKSSFLPKYEQNIVKISALWCVGGNSDNFSFLFCEKR